MASFDRSTHRLAGSGNEAGGLIIKKKQIQNPKQSDDVFKQPSGSLLGLDVLARRKRAEREAEESSARGEKRPKIERKNNNKDSYDDSGVRLSFGRSGTAKDRNYRASLLDTPSHPGGVSEQALEVMQSRLKRDQGQGLYASSSGAREKEQRGKERGNSSDRREKERSRGRGDDRGDESRRRVREREWEQETPRSDRGRGNTTPYLKARCKLMRTQHTTFITTTYIFTL